VKGNPKHHKEHIKRFGESFNIRPSHGGIERGKWAKARWQEGNNLKSAVKKVQSGKGMPKLRKAS